MQIVFNACFFVKMNLPEFDFKIRKSDEKYQIFDRIRKCFVALTPEEWVRQHMVSHLVENLGYPQNLIANEVSLSFNGMQKRCDSIVYDRDFKPLIIAEYKAESVEITQKVFDQAAVYNQRLGVPYFLLSNGNMHIFCKVDESEKCYRFFQDIPTYSELLESPK